MLKSISSPPSTAPLLHQHPANPLPSPPPPSSTNILQPPSSPRRPRRPSPTSLGRDLQHPHLVATTTNQQEQPPPFKSRSPRTTTGRHLLGLPQGDLLGPPQIATGFEDYGGGGTEVFGDGGEGRGGGLQDVGGGGGRWRVGKKLI